MKFSQLNMIIRLGREFGHEQIRDAGFTDTEHAICTFLCFHENVSQDRIANALMLDKTTVAKALSTMERKGLITRAQNELNRRENIIQISDAGRASVSASIDVYDTWLGEICSCLTEKESAQLDSFLTRMVTCALQRREQTKQNEKREAL